MLPIFNKEILAELNTPEFLEDMKRLEATAEVSQEEE